MSNIGHSVMKFVYILIHIVWFRKHPILRDIISLICAKDCVIWLDYMDHFIHVSAPSVDWHMYELLYRCRYGHERHVVVFTYLFALV